MGILDSVHDPADLRRLDHADLESLADELREFLIASVCRTGGHLGPNLGMVELTLALHRVFDSPRHPLIFDTGHQAYVHKIVTGRRDGFASLRTAGGVSGYPSRTESPHDLVENSHASTALSYADGLAKAFSVAGMAERPVVAIVGDGALTGGMAWEAMNNIGGSGWRIVVVLNDNGRSYSPTVGGLAAHLKRLQDRVGYETLIERLGGNGTRGPLGQATTTRPDALFTALGFDYIGPVDGHDLAELETALTQARDHNGPVVVHCRTHKGAGYTPALDDHADHLHAVSTTDRATGKPAKPSASTWTDAFATALVTIGGERTDVVAVSAAMLGPTKLQRFAERYPARCFDVGIAEQHALTSAAGMAMAGAHPVVALYATFANRAFDQTLLDVGLHRLPVTLVLDRAGVTGPDGPSHHGMWDLAMLGTVPGMKVAAPRDADTLLEELHEAIGCDSGPTALRFPKSKLDAPVPAVGRFHGVDLVRSPRRTDVLLVAVGATVAVALHAADTLAGEHIECTVADPRWVLPVNPALAELANAHDAVVTVEDGIRDGGFGQRLASLVAEHGVSTPVHNVGLPSAYIPHGARPDLLARYGLDAAGVANAVRCVCNQRSVQAPLRLLAHRAAQADPAATG